MALRSTQTSVPAAKSMRLSTAVLSIILAFAAGLILGPLILPGQTVPVQVMAPQAGQPNTPMPPQNAPAQGRLAVAQERTRQQPLNPVAWIELGNIWYDASDPAQAIPAYIRALELDPENGDVRTDLGTCYRMTGNFEQAISAYNETLIKNPRHANARLNKGVVLYYDLGRKQEALDVWNTLLSLNPDAKAPNNMPLKEFIARHTAQ